MRENIEILVAAEIEELITPPAGAIAKYLHARPPAAVRCAGVQRLPGEKGVVRDEMNDSFSSMLEVHELPPVN